MTVHLMRSREAVLEALAECDRLGTEAFLRLYGFGRSRRYRLVHEGRDYDSKAIVGVAHGREFPVEGPLRSGDFSGGLGGAVAILTRLGFEVVDDDGPRAAAPQPSQAPRPSVLPRAEELDERADVVLIGCGKSKQPAAAPACELYTGGLFRKRRAYAEGAGRPWFIVSALHGLVRPDRVLEPYDLALSDQSAAQRLVWGRRVVDELTAEIGDLTGALIEVHAGAAYADALDQPLRQSGVRLVRPLRGLTQGRQLQWYANGGEPPALRPAGSAGEHSPAGTGIALRVLADGAAARSPVGFPWGDARLSQPGLYSWWVDESGAAQLSDGLGLTLSPGLVYAGQAGATSSRAALERSATLASRIGSNHLRGRISSSTWRLSLAALLQDALELNFEHRPRLAEEDLSAWMLNHLSLVAHPVPDRAALAQLELQVLEELDPPLNLQGMAVTPARRALSLLRSALRAGASL